MIGGTTNFLAIRMLFRPHRQWRLLGMRVPLTPGMIPARQAELADSVAETVSGHLIPPEELVNALDTDQFQAVVRRTIETNLSENLEAPVGDTISKFGGDWDRIVAIACDNLQANLIAVAETDEVRRALEAMARRQSVRLADHLAEKLPPPIFSPIRSIFEKRFEPIIRQAVAAALHDCIKSPATIATMIEEVRPRIEENIRDARPSEYVPERATARIAETATRRVMEFIRRDAEQLIANLDIRSVVANRIRSFPSEKIEKLTVECARRELTAITLFGFFLGALVGLLNPLLQHFLG